MKKSIFIIGLFVVIGTVALVYAIEYLGPGSVPDSVKRYFPRHVTQDPPVNTVSVNSTSNVSFEWKLGNPYLLKGSDGNVFLDLQVTGKTLTDVKRKQMNLVLVIDRSGSMGSENKLEQVKDAAASIVRNMNPADRLSIVIYDDTIQTLVPSSPVENKERFLEALAGLSPGGSTNLCGGLQQGADEVRKNFRKDFVNRIILLSDGLANVGITDPDQIGAEAKRIRENGVSVSTMGVGIDYNENLMANIADDSGGNYYYISKEVNMAEVFRREWNLMQSLVATKAKTILQLGEGVDVVEVAGFRWAIQGRKLTVEVPDIYSGETKRILVQLRAPAGATRIVNLGQGEFVCNEISGGKARSVQLAFNPKIRVVEDQALIASSENRAVSAKVASVSASKDMDKAYRLYEAGDQSGAYSIAHEAWERLKSLGYTANAKQVQRYEGTVLTMAEPSAPPPEEQKDFLKKQKEAERASQQSTAQ